jgi:enoyl-CoA hydratase/carnithine racemase
VSARPGPAAELERQVVAPNDVSAALLWLNRPDSLNAIDSAMVHGIEEALREAEADDRVCVVLITGRGSAFSAGGDLKGYRELQRDVNRFPAFVDDLLRAFGGISSMTKPVVALVNGPTVAGGLELMLACDFSYAAESAYIGDGHLKFGQMAGGGSLAHLPRTIGPSRARELLFSARLLSAAEALDWGLVNRVVPDGELIEAGLEFARGVAERSPRAVANMKHVMNHGFADGTGLDAALRLERERAVLYCLTQPDSMEGLNAFVDKREPKFPGR